MITGIMMNNLQAITKAHPEYYILKQTIVFLQKMGMSVTEIEQLYGTKYNLSESVLSGLFPKYHWGFDPAKFKEMIQGNWRPSHDDMTDTVIYGKSFSHICVDDLGGIKHKPIPICTIIP